MVNYRWLWHILSKLHELEVKLPTNTNSSKGNFSCYINKSSLLFYWFYIIVCDLDMIPLLFAICIKLTFDSTWKQLLTVHFLPRSIPTYLRMVTTGPLEVPGVLSLEGSQPPLPWDPQGPSSLRVHLLFKGLFLVLWGMLFYNFLLKGLYHGSEFCSLRS